MLFRLMAKNIYGSLMAKYLCPSCPKVEKLKILENGEKTKVKPRSASVSFCLHLLKLVKNYVCSRNYIFNGHCNALGTLLKDGSITDSFIELKLFATC